MSRPVVILASLLLARLAPAQELTTAERTRIDSIANAVLQATGAPGATIAIVRGAQIVYEHSYGAGRVEPNAPATPVMRYAIGSVSKQFTATAVLLLAEDGKLSLDDKVAKWFPHLTRASEISVRQLLSMTSGYQDYWPQDYVFLDMQRPVQPAEILQRWAGKGLDFDPGTRWQYSNTNYVLAASIVERVSGKPFMDVLRERIFTPLKMTSVADFDAGPLGPGDAAPLLRHATGPLRPAPKEARGWLFGAGQLGMTAHDLALWNIGIIKRSLLKPESYRQQQSGVVLANGVATGYGLGMNVTDDGGRRRLTHGGAVSGYTTTNAVYPDDGIAITVFTNIYPGGSSSSGNIAARISAVLAPRDTTVAAARDQARQIYDGLARGTIDRARFTPNANDFFSAPVLADYASSLGPLGAPTEFAAGGESLRGGMKIRSYRIVAGGVRLNLTVMSLPDGRIDQFIVERGGG